MISIFHRIRLSNTFDELQKQKIVTALRKNHIPYKIKIKNPSAYSFRPAASRGFTGSYGVSEKSRFEFIFYVDKSDYDRARQILYMECGL